MEVPSFFTVYRQSPSGRRHSAIVVKKGTYQLSDYALNDDVIIIANDAVFTSSGSSHIIIGGAVENVELKGITFTGASDVSIIASQAATNLALEDVKFINNSGTSVITSAASLEISAAEFTDNTVNTVILSTGDLEIVNSLFESNTVTNIIKADSGFVDVSYTIFANNIAAYEGSVLGLLAASGVSASADNNFWGTNNPNAGYVSGVTLANWIIVSTSADDLSVVFNGDNLTLNSVLKTSDGTSNSSFAGTLAKDIEIVLSSDLGNNLTHSTLTVGTTPVSTVYSAINAGNEQITVAMADDTLLDTIAFYINYSNPDYIYVNAATGSDASGTGKINKPYATIEKAVEVNNKAGGGKTIIVAEGTYTPSNSSGYYIAQDVSIIGEGNVIIDGQNSKIHFNVYYSALNLSNLVLANGRFSSYSSYMGASISARTADSLNISDCTFINNTYTSYYDGGIIYADGDDGILFDRCVFVNNNVQPIYSYGSYHTALIYTASNMTVKNSIFLNNVYPNNMFYNYYSSYVVTANNNYWGSNTPNLATVNNRSGIIADNWVIVDSDVIEQVTRTDSIDLSLYLNKVTNGSMVSDLAGTMPKVMIDASADIGSISSTAVLEDNKATFAYNALSIGDETLVFSIYGEEIFNLSFAVEDYDPAWIYVDASNGDDTTGTGDKANPFATLTRALDENNASGGGKTIIVKSGNYVLNGYTLRDNVTITGQGNVTIAPSSSSNYHLSISASAKNVSLIGLSFVNGTGVSAASISVSTLSSGNEGRYLTITDCNFVNNKGQRIIASYINTTITRTNFINSTVTGRSGDWQGIIAVLDGSLEISHSTFINTNASNGGIGGIYIKESSEWDEETFEEITLSPYVLANYNFWGSNDMPTSSLVSQAVNLTLENWVILSLETETDLSEVFNDDVITFVIDFSKYTDGTEVYDLEGSMPAVDVSLSSDLGNPLTADALSVKTTANTIYTASEIGNETLTLSLADSTVLDTEIFFINYSDPDIIYVDGTLGSDETGNGKINKPFASIARALNITNATPLVHKTILVKEGVYVLTSELFVNSTVAIVGEGNVVLDASTSRRHFSLNTAGNLTLENLNLINGNHFMGGASINAPRGFGLYIYNCTFTNNSVKFTSSYGQAGIINSSVATVVNCSKFINNIANGTVSGSDMAVIVIAGYPTPKIVCNSIFINNTVSDYMVYGTSGIVNYNYWGSNNNKTNSVYSYLTLENWVILSCDCDFDDVMQTDSFDMDFEMSKYTDGINIYDLENPMPEFNISGLASIGEISPAGEQSTVNTQSSFNYAANTAGEENLKFFIYSYEVLDFTFVVAEYDVDMVYVDAASGSDETGTGSKKSPYASIEKALNMSTDGTKTIVVKEGTYTLNGYYLSNNVRIIGNGEVIIAPNTSSTNHLSLGANAKNVTLIGLSFVNGTSYSAASISQSTSSSGNAGRYLNIINCSFINNKGSRIISNYINTTIIGTN